MPSTGWDPDQVPAAQGSQEMVLWEPLPKDLDLKHGKNTAQVTASPGGNNNSWLKNCRNPPTIYGGLMVWGYILGAYDSINLMTWCDFQMERTMKDYKYSTSFEVTQNKPWGLRKVPLGREMKKPHCGSCSDWTDLFLGVAAENCREGPKEKVVKTSMTSWWLNQPIWKILVKLDRFPR